MSPVQEEVLSVLLERDGSNNVMTSYGYRSALTALAANGFRAVRVVDLRSAISLIRGVSLPLDMGPWRDDLLRRLEMAATAADDGIAKDGAS